jgi:electron transport complex protein RnfB
VDAFVGASKVMTTVIEDECTGCDLCIPVCPVDCIYIKETQQTVKNYMPDINEVTYA